MSHCVPYINHLMIDGYLFPLFYICLFYDEVLLFWEFGTAGFDIRQKLKSTVFNIFDLNFKCSYQIVSLVDMYTDIGKRIAWKQYGPILIIKAPPPGTPPPPNSKKLHFYTLWPIYEQLVICITLLFICLQCDESCI